MFEFKRMVEYRDTYMYDSKEEKIVFLDVPHVEYAKRCYRFCWKALKDNERITLWHFDVALSLLKDLSEEDIEYMKGHPSISEYHHGYGTYIRNQYVYPSKKILNYVFADDVSTTILHVLLTMVHPKYDFRNPALCTYYNSYDYSTCVDLYYEKYRECFDELEDYLIDNGHSKEIKDPIDLLKKSLKSKMGKRGFLEAIDYTFRDVNEDEAYHKHYDEGKYRVQVFIYRLGFFVPIHNLEYQQLDALTHIGAFRCLNLTEEEPATALKAFIDENLNLKDEDRDFMIECILKINGMFNVHERY